MSSERRYKRPLTDRQRAYLDAVDEHIHAGDPDTKNAAAARMGAAADELLAEAHVARPGRKDRSHDLVDVLVRRIAGGS